MASEAFTVREINGQRRSVSLLDRALPYQKVAFSRAQRVTKRIYPGNPAATLAVQGVEEKDLVIEGKWKSRFTLATLSVELIGFDDIASGTGFQVGAGFTDDAGTIAADDLVEVFNRLLESGATLEIVWAREVSIGVLSEFTPTYDRVEDIAWSMTFTRSRRGIGAPSRASGAVDTVSAVRVAYDQLDLAAAEMPTSILPAQRSGIMGALDEMRAAGAAMTEKLAEIQDKTTATIADVQAVQTIAKRAQQAGEALKSGNLADMPYVALVPLDDVISTCRADAWRHDMSRKTSSAQAVTNNAAGAVAAKVEPGVMAVITTNGQSLRRIAAQYYGNADAWTLIADANGIVGSQPPAGTRIVVPRSGAVAR